MEGQRKGKGCEESERGREGERMDREGRKSQIRVVEGLEREQPDTLTAQLDRQTGASAQTQRNMRATQGRRAPIDTFKLINYSED